LAENTKRTRLLGVAALVVVSATIAAFLYFHLQEAAYADLDVAIINGRVIDPETGLDETGYNVGVRGRMIIAVTRRKLTARKVIDATGLVVAPGFIDVLSYDPNGYGVWFKIADGVTTNLAMHGGAVRPGRWLDKFEKARPPVHFGAAFFYNSARLRLGIKPYSPANEDEIKRLTEMAEAGIKDGAIGIGMSPEYSPGTTTGEIEAMARVARRFNVPVFFHVRYSDMEEPGTNIEALAEVIEVAGKTGAAIHIDHINSTGGTFSMEESLRMLDTAVKAGVDVTACTYPYPFWATYLNSARFDTGWQKRFRITFSDLQIGGTEERLTEETFVKYRKLGKLAVAYAIPEEDVIEALKSPLVMIGSDGIMGRTHNHHPRAAGAYSRTIARYVRELKVLSLSEAIGKMTIMPAKRLEASAPALKRKGRIQARADADIVVFDLERIADKATVVEPARASVGIEYVLVNGRIVKDPEGLKKDVRPGEPIRFAPPPPER
jgi:N-acyl-D-aspartate/D-glutamate deacylase